MKASSSSSSDLGELTGRFKADGGVQDIYTHQFGCDARLLKAIMPRGQGRQQSDATAFPSSAVACYDISARRDRENRSKSGISFPSAERTEMTK